MPWLVIGGLVVLAWAASTKGQTLAGSAPSPIAVVPQRATVSPIASQTGTPAVAVAPAPAIVQTAPPVAPQSAPSTVLPAVPQQPIQQAAIKTLQSDLNANLKNAVTADVATGSYTGFGAPQAPGQPDATFGGSVPGFYAPLNFDASGFDVSGLNLGPGITTPTGFGSGDFGGVGL